MFDDVARCKKLLRWQTSTILPCFSATPSPSRVWAVSQRVTALRKNLKLSPQLFHPNCTTQEELSLHLASCSLAKSTGKTSLASRPALQWATHELPAVPG
jgi:hypothetical protein